MKHFLAWLVIAFLSGCAKKDLSQELALLECQRQLALTQRELDSALIKLEEMTAERHREVQTLLKDPSAKASELFQPQKR